MAAAAVAGRVNLKTRHGREIARAAAGNPLYVISPSPPTLPSKKLTVYQQAVADYKKRVHVLRVAFQKQHQLHKQSDDAVLARRVETIRAAKARREKTLNYEKQILKAKNQELAIRLAEVKAEEKEQHTLNRIKCEEELKKRKLAVLQFCLKEREGHWEEKHKKLTPHLFDQRYTGITGYWVRRSKPQYKRNAGIDRNALFSHTIRPGDVMESDDEDDLRLLNFHRINENRTTYQPEDIHAPQFKKSPAERAAVKLEKKEAKLAKIRLRGTD